MNDQICFPSFDITKTIENIALTGAVCIPEFLSKNTLRILTKELAHLEMTRAEEIVGKHNVVQRFSYTSNFNINGNFTRLQEEFNRYINEKFLAHSLNVLSEALILNDMVALVYEPGEIGISVHRDPKSFINLIFVFILEGNGEFYVCSDRHCNDSQLIINNPGDLVIMRAPGFLGEAIQPFHYVKNIKSPRVSLAMRHLKVTEALKVNYFKVPSDGKIRVF